MFIQYYWTNAQLKRKSHDIHVFRQSSYHSRAIIQTCSRHLFQQHWFGNSKRLCLATSILKCRQSQRLPFVGYKTCKVQKFKLKERLIKQQIDLEIEEQDKTYKRYTSFFNKLLSLKQSIWFFYNSKSFYFPNLQIIYSMHAGVLINIHQ